MRKYQEIKNVHDGNAYGEGCVRNVVTKNINYTFQDIYVRAFQDGLSYRRTGRNLEQSPKRNKVYCRGSSWLFRVDAL